MTAIRRDSLIRGVYRALISSGRSYAAFTNRDRRLVERVRDRCEILDPMSGYGLLTRFCAEFGVRSYCVELNLPQYYWQVLCHPANSVGFLISADALSSRRSSWPRTRTRAVVSDEWYPDESRAILRDLMRVVHDAVAFSFPDGAAHGELTVALLLPFVGRLACSTAGNIVTHTKRGGLCVYRDWHSDLAAYLSALGKSLVANAHRSCCRDHVTVWGDARTAALPPGRFRAMVTSPPYPNRHDFASMFLPECAFLDIVNQEWALPSASTADLIIGSNTVAGRKDKWPTIGVARGFLDDIRESVRNENAVRQDDRYFIPYYANYFADLEAAYANVAGALARDFEGYVVVVNNAHRNLVVPVAQSVVEIWQRLGFEAEIAQSTEMFHVGTMNPRARGLKAKHTEYAIRVWR